VTFSLCVVGNSHVAAFKQAWDKRRPALRDGVEATFFSAQNRLMKDMVPKGKSLVAAGDLLAEKLRYTSGGLDRIDIDRYDAFLVVGAGFGIDVPRLIEDCGVTTPWRFDAMGPPLSHRCLQAVIEAYNEDSMAVRLIEAVQRVSDAPVLVAGAPYVSERVAQDEDQPWLKDNGFVEAFVDCARRAAEATAARHKVEIVWQRPETIARTGFMNETFNTTPARFEMRTKAPPFDVKHGNLDYGAMMLADALARLDQLTGGRLLA
jgi:hypothetical protein